MQVPDNTKTAVRVIGTVSSFDEDKGYGFVAQGGGKELFVDQAAIDSDGFSILAIGDHVRYVVIEGSEGPCVSSARAY